MFRRASFAPLGASFAPLPASFASLALALAFVPACAAVDPSVHEEPIVGGTLESGYRPVYYLINFQGGACTGTLISPRVVLTARHCVVDMSTDAPSAPRFFRVYAGSSERTFYAEYRVSEVHIIPGSTGNIGDGLAQDLGLLVLSAPAAETPIEMARDVSAGALIGNDATAIGFGQTPSGSSGTKMRGVAHVNALQEGLIFVDPSVCSGDSGGPLIGADGLIYGVASFIYSPDGSSEPRCGTAPGAYNEIFRHMEWITGVLEAVGDECVPDPEICDGLDNDCNGVADEPCLALGDPCTTNEECGTGLCDVVGGVRVCTQECDPQQGALGCGLGMYCSVTGCSGRCTPGTPGTAGVGAACTMDLDCASGFCRDPGDGRQRCLAPCERDRAECLSAEVCVPLDGSSCGGCVSSAIVAGARALGEPCAAPSDCTSGFCVVRAGLGECAVPCSGTTCAEGFVCHDGMCVTDRRQPIGGGCAENADCQTGICAQIGELHFCTAFCSSDAGCPGSFHCDSTSSGVCAPSAGLDGAACTTGTDCVSGLCGSSSSGGICVSFCTAEMRCGAGLECTRTADGTSAVCTRPPSHAGGCSASRSSSSARAPAGLAFVVLAIAVTTSRRNGRLRRRLAAPR